MAPSVAHLYHTTAHWYVCRLNKHARNTGGGGAVDRTFAKDKSYKLNGQKNDEEMYPEQKLPSYHQNLVRAKDKTMQNAIKAHPRM